MSVDLLQRHISLVDDIVDIEVIRIGFLIGRIKAVSKRKVTMILWIDQNEES